MTGGLTPGGSCRDEGDKTGDDIVDAGGPWLWNGIGKRPAAKDLTAEPARSGERYVGRHRVDPNDPPEPKGFGTDPYGRTAEDWKTHAE